MPTQILMPRLSPTMEEGKLANWHVKEGDAVRSGDVVAEIETDKATMEVEAPEDGTIGKLLVAGGTEHVPVNFPIAVLVIDDEGDSSLETRPAAAPQDEGDARRAASAPHPEEARSAVSKGEARDSSAEEVMHRIAAQIRGDGTSAQAERVFSSPLARRLARELGLNLAALDGSGPHGRIVKADVEEAARGAMRAAERAEAAPAEAVSAEIEPVEIDTEAARHPQELVARNGSPERDGLSDRQVLALYQPGSYEIVPHDTMRRFIAERLTLAKRSIPHFYLAIDCELDALIAARKRLNALAPQEGPRAFKLSINDFIVKAMAMALQTVPAANATWTEQGLLRHRASDIAVAVALEGGGLHTPVIRDAEIKSLSEISNELRDLAARARSKRLAPHEYQGGSTTISNLGMYGIDRFDAVINPPQASILAVGRAEKRPVVKDDVLKIATMMSVTLSVDHRVIDGALGAELLAAFKAYLEDPVTMLV
ncbi:MAG TPA: pyruvate dehydrogenase complex dihydrolipoamide acetyltransferase [Methyloceanibacter sp.]|nr:pyruvate dehydrogenase complex dihydrolipoamide acetyltransferase [Methyloceanibacter sp.]